MGINGPMSLDPNDIPRVKRAKYNLELEKTKKAIQDSIMVENQKRRDFQLDSMKLENEKLILLTKVSKPDEKEVNAISDGLYDAIKGLGTDNTAFERTLLKIDKSNVIEVMNKWDSKYGKKYNETFMESFLNDANRRQKKVFGTRIIECMEQRAKDHNVDLGKFADNAKAELYTLGSNFDINQNVQQIRERLRSTEY